MNRTLTRSERRQFEQENARQPTALARVPKSAWPAAARNSKLIDAWRSRDYLLQIFQEPAEILRLSVCRTTMLADGEWAQDIPWEDLQRLKRECGLGKFDALEVYPADIDVVNVANMRHLWVLPRPLPFVWRRK